MAETPPTDSPENQENIPPAAVSDPAETTPVSVTTDIDDEHMDSNTHSALRPADAPAENVEMVKPVYSPKTKDEVADETNSLPLIGNSIDEINKNADHYRNMDAGRSREMGRWLITVQGGQQHMQTGDALGAALLRPSALWRQSVTAEGQQLGAGLPGFGEKKEGGRLSGPQAMMKMRGLLNMGTVARVPLWGTGIWVNFRAPSEMDLLELQRKISQEKIELGRLTNGLIFSNTSVYMMSYLSNFALSHVYEATYRQVEQHELKRIILQTDYQQLIWGLLCTIYPNGYLYRMPCLHDPTKCKHVIEEKLNVNKICWVDDRILTKEQRKHMVNRVNAFSDEEIKRYQEAHDYTNKHGIVDLTPRLRMVLKVPTLAEAERSGFDWIDGIVSRTDKAFGGTLSDKERNLYISQQGVVSGLRQYGAWIDKILLLDENGHSENVVDDEASIEDAISVLTGNEEVYAAFFKAIGDFIDNTAVSVIAVPRIHCPMCQQPVAPENEKHPHLVALDTPATFFTLLDQRLMRILS